MIMRVEIDAEGASRRVNCRQDEKGSEGFRRCKSPDGAFVCCRRAQSRMRWRKDVRVQSGDLNCRKAPE